MESWPAPGPVLGDWGYRDEPSPVVQGAWAQMAMWIHFPVCCLCLNKSNHFLSTNPVLGALVGTRGAPAPLHHSCPPGAYRLLTEIRSACETVTNAIRPSQCCWGSCNISRRAQLAPAAVGRGRIPRVVRKEVGFKLFSAGRIVHVQLGRTWNRILRRNIIHLVVRKQKTCSGDTEASLVQPRGEEEGTMGLHTREKRDVLSYRRKPSSGSCRGERGDWESRC